MYEVEMVENVDGGTEFFLRITDKDGNGFDGPIMSTPAEAFKAFGIHGGYYFDAVFAYRTK